MEPTTTTQTTTQTTIPNVEKIDAVLGLLNTPEYKAQVKKARRKQTFRYWKTRLTIDALLIALGFVLGIFLI